VFERPVCNPKGVLQGVIVCGLFLAQVFLLALKSREV